MILLVLLTYIAQCDLVIDDSFLTKGFADASDTVKYIKFVTYQAPSFRRPD